MLELRSQRGPGQRALDTSEWSPWSLSDNAGSRHRRPFGTLRRHRLSSALRARRRHVAVAARRRTLARERVRPRAADERGAADHLDTVSASGGVLVFHNTFDASCSAAFKACVTSAEDELSTLFTNADTVNVSFHEKNAGASFALSNGWPSSTTVSYATLKAALPSSDVLPSSNPAPAGSHWSVPEAYARMLGLSSSTPSNDDSSP